MRNLLAWSRWLCLGILGLLCAADPSWAAPVAYGDVIIDPEPEPRGEMFHGYAEYRFWVSNKNKERAYRVRLELPADRTRSGLNSVSRTIEIGPGQTATLSLLQPAAPPTSGHGANVYIDGVLQRDNPLRFNVIYGRSGISSQGAGRRGMFYYGSPSVSDESALMLISQRINEEFVKAGNSGRVPMVMPGGPGPVPPIAPVAPQPGEFQWFGALTNTQVIRAEQRVPVWSSRWLGYSRYDGIVLDLDDVLELHRGPPASQEILQALWRYTETGGVLVVLGRGQLPVPTTWARYRYTEGPMTAYAIGFGQCLHSSDRNFQGWSQDQWSQLSSSISQTVSPWRVNENPFEANAKFPVVDDLGVPVGGLFGLLFVFGVLIGPVNIAVLNRWNRRIWLLWTVPVLSALFCLMVLGYMIAAEGWTGHCRVSGLTILDEREKRATSVGMTGFYCPLTPGDGLRFSEDTEVQIPGAQHSAFEGGCAIDWTGEQHLSRGWVSARIPAHFLLRKSEAQRRERVALVREDGGWSAQNLLGVDLKYLLFADEQGLLYRGDTVAAGQQVRLQPLNSRIPEDRQRAWRERFRRGGWSDRWEQSLTNHETLSLLVPNSYLAITESSPFLEQGLKSARLRPSLSGVLGILP